MDAPPDIAAALDLLFRTAPQSPTLRAVFREAFGDDAPDDAEPLSFVSRTELARVAEALAVGPGDTLLDVGCGRGGPGAWVAARTGASLIGVDRSPAAIEAARGGTRARASTSSTGRATAGPMARSQAR